MIILLAGCKNDIVQNQNPNLIITHQIDGLKITLNGNVLDVDGSIINLSIDWGDNKISKLQNNSYSNFEINHLYSLPLNSNIKVIAIDNVGDTTLLVIPINLDYKETSLLGVKKSMFKTTDNELLILTVNLHTYQELQQNEKFVLLADVIGKMDIDFIAFQECAQKKTTAITAGIIRQDNMALIISNIIKEKYKIDYNYVWSWAHYGWNDWEEGVSVLSKHPIVNSENRYISTGTSVSNITSRKAICGSYQTPNGLINVISAHTHWRTSTSDEEQNNQILNIKAMVAEKELLTPNITSFVCGDFNGNPTSDYPWSEGYNTIMRNNDYLDTFLEVYPDANNKPAQSIYFTIFGDLPGRIDYIFMKKNEIFKVVDSQIILKPEVIGKISDHYGVLTKIESYK